MALQFQTLTVNTLPANNQSVTFAGTINAANAAVQGFNLSYGPDTDQYIDTMYVTISGVQVTGNQVSFNVDANMQSEDDTTSIHTDKGSGSVTVLVIADVNIES